MRILKLPSLADELDRIDTRTYIRSGPLNLKHNYHALDSPVRKANKKQAERKKKARIRNKNPEFFSFRSASGKITYGEIL